MKVLMQNRFFAIMYYLLLKSWIANKIITLHMIIIRGAIRLAYELSLDDGNGRQICPYIIKTVILSVL